VLVHKQWILVGSYRDQDTASPPPFEAITIDLNDLWTGF